MNDMTHKQEGRQEGGANRRFGRTAAGAAVVLAMLVSWPDPALALRLAPGQEPLQPAAPNVSPNYSESVQSGAGIERANGANAPETTVPVASPTGTAQVADPDATPPGRDVTASPVTSDGQTWLLLLMVLLVSAGISGLYYWYRTSKQNP